MANLKISQLTAGTPAQAGDLLPVDRTGVNFNVTAASIAALALTGTPALPNGTTATTQAPLTSNTDVATDAYADAAVAVEKARALAAEALLAPLVSPTFTGTPTAPTKTPLTNNTDISTTAYADAAVAVEVSRAETAEALLAPKASPTFTGISTFPQGTAVAPTIVFAAETTTGFSAATGFVLFDVSGAATGGFGGSYIGLTSTKGFVWASGTFAGAGADTGLFRDSAGVIDVGNGSTSDKSGSINLTNLTASGTVRSNTSFSANGLPGASAGPFTAITSITTSLGIVTALSGTSDARLKNAVPYEGGLDEILAISPVKYTWNEKGVLQTGLSGTQEFVGFIAQDVQRAIPFAITTTEKSKTGNEEYLSLDDRPIVAALVNAVKTLLLRVEKLESVRL